jgi:hypothetical protein
MEPKYKVLLFEDNIYQVFAWNKEIMINNRLGFHLSGDFDYNTVVFQGTLPECEAWIHLKEGGYL